jgi:hypothetical protein
MYRIELRAGEEAIYKTFDEFAKAVRTGVVDTHARVWHGASEKWLPITFHPHYKRAMTAPESGAAPAAAVAPARAPAVPPAPAPAPAVIAKAAVPEPVAPPVMAPKTHELEFIELPNLTPQGPRAVSGSLFGPPAATPRHIEALVAAADQAPAPVPASTGSDEILIDISKPRLGLVNRRVMGIAAGVVLVAGAVAMLMSHRPGSQKDAGAADSSATMASTSLAATPSNSFEVTAPPETLSGASSGQQSGTQRGTMYMPMPSIPDGPATTSAPADSGKILPAAPRLGQLTAGNVTATGSSPAALGARYNAAHDAADAALESRLRASGITALFSDARLGNDRVSDARMAVSGIANFIRTFRLQDAAIEKAYRDSAVQLSEDWSVSEKSAWAQIMTRGESSAAARSADQLLSDISSMLGVLEEQAGAYDLSGGKVTFRDAGATLRYGALRRRVADRLAAGDSASAVASSITKVIGPTKPPVENYSE